MAGDGPGCDPRTGQGGDQLVGSTTQVCRVGLQRPDSRRRAAQRRLERGERQLVDAQRPGERAAAQPFHQVGGAEQQTGLRAAEQLVGTAGHQVGTVTQRGGGVRLEGQQRVPAQQPGAEIGHQWHAALAQRPAELGHLTLEVKPWTTKFDGCTLSTMPVSSPTAAR